MTTKMTISVLKLYVNASNPWHSRINIKTKEFRAFILSKEEGLPTNMGDSNHEILTLNSWITQCNNDGSLRQTYYQITTIIDIKAMDSRPGSLARGLGVRLITSHFKNIFVPKHYTRSQNSTDNLEWTWDRKKFDSGYELFEFLWTRHWTSGFQKPRS